MSVPALPQSIGSSGARRPRSPAPTHADDVDVLVDHLHAELPDRRDRRLGVPGAAEPADDRLPLADRGHEQRPVGDRLVARDRDVTDEGARGRDDLDIAGVAERLERRRDDAA